MIYSSTLPNAVVSNASKVFRIIYQNERVSKQQIANLLSMSLPTVTQYLKYLDEIGAITEVGEFKSNGGRKAKAISCVKDFRYAIGLDITRNHIGVVVINMTAEIIKHTRIKKVFKRSHEYFQALGSMIDDFISELEIDSDKILGVGISIPGIFDEKHHKLVHSHPLGISNVNCREFAEYIPYTCRYCNDANAACIAEMWNKEITSNVVYLSLSYSVGGSVMFNNQIYSGDNQRGAEFGHMTLFPHGKHCYCGKNGCVDTYCSAYVITESSKASVEEFFERLNGTGASDLQAIWDEYLDNLAMAINNIRMALDCDIIVGGYIGSFLDEHIQSLRKIVASINTFEKDAQYLKPCTYKIESSAVGAALLNIEAYIDSL